MTESGLQYKDAKMGEGVKPEAGDRVVVDWSGYTIGRCDEACKPQVFVRPERAAQPSPSPSPFAKSRQATTAARSRCGHEWQAAASVRES